MDKAKAGGLELVRSAPGMAQMGNFGLETAVMTSQT
jgi:hypothetical protein